VSPSLVGWFRFRGEQRRRRARVRSYFARPAAGCDPPCPGFAGAGVAAEPGGWAARLGRRDGDARCAGAVFGAGRCVDAGATDRGRVDRFR